MENMFQSFSCISFLFKPPWIYSHFISKQNLKITNLIFGNNFFRKYLQRNCDFNEINKRCAFGWGWGIDGK